MKHASIGLMTRPAPETLRIRRLPVDREAQEMARMAIRFGEAGLEDVRRQHVAELAPVVGHQAAEQAGTIIVPESAPSSEQE